MGINNIQRVIIEQVCDNPRGRFSGIVWKVILVPYDQTDFYKLVGRPYVKPKNRHHKFNTYDEVLSFMQEHRLEFK